MMHRYERVCTLGDGTYGQVLLYRRFDTGEKVAIKRYGGARFPRLYPLRFMGGSWAVYGRFVGGLWAVCLHGLHGRTVVVCISFLSIRVFQTFSDFVRFSVFFQNETEVLFVGRSDESAGSEGEAIPPVAMATTSSPADAVLA